MDKLIADLIGNAEKIGSLSTSAVLALVCLGETTYLIWDAKAKKAAQELGLQLHIKDAESDIMFATALEKIRDEMREWRIKIKCIGEVK